jgi:tetratricopeptide (TPR) repeat protein
MNRHVILGLLLVAVTVAVFLPVRGFEFINYDDTDYITNNEMVARGLSGEGVRWALTAGRSATWQPLVWISLMADVRDGEPDPAVFHTTNLVLHVLNVLLLYLLLVMLTGRALPAAFVAVLFAVHPLHVESVAWVTERKDVLSTFWGLLSLLAWVRWVRRGGTAWYLATAVALVLGLMAKPMLVTWPFVMLLLDWWPLERWGVRQPGALVREKLPLFALVVVVSIVAFNVQSGDEAVASWETLALGQRLTNAVDAYGAYLVKTVWPKGLSILYPHPYMPGGTPLTALAVSGALLVLAAITAVVWWQRRRRYLLLGWFWFLGTLVPVIGLVQIGVHAYADRFTYVPLIGIFVALVWLAVDLAGQRRVRALTAAGVVAVGILAVVAHARVGDWHDSITLYEASLANAPGSPRIHYNLGLAYSRTDRHRDAIGQYQAALGKDPSHAKAWNNLGRSLDLMGVDDKSEMAFQEALRRKTPYPTARINYAILLDRTGRRDAAIEQRLLALRDDPDNAANHNVVGSLLAMSGRLDEALEHFRHAARLEPGNGQYRANLQRATRMIQEQGSP